MKSILIQLDTDSQPSSFDRVVAVDAGIDELFSYGGVRAEECEPLIHGAIFTRGPQELKNTALFVGGSDVPAGEELLQKIQATFFGPMRVSVMMDSNGSNTTAAAAVLAAERHLQLAGCEALVLGGTGPVGQRVAQLLAQEGARVRVGSRSADRARQICRKLGQTVTNAELQPADTGNEAALEAACQGVALVIAAGAPGVQFLSAAQRQRIDSLQVAIDLNAVPPAGMEGVEVTDKAEQRDGVTSYGAVGVGGTKMKIHKAALAQLFETNDRVLETEAIFQIGREIAG